MLYFSHSDRDTCLRLDTNDREPRRAIGRRRYPLTCASGGHRSTTAEADRKRSCAEVDGAGTVEAAGAATWFDIAGSIDVAVRVPLVSLWLPGVEWIAFRAALAGRFAGRIAHRRAGLTAHADVAATCALEQ